MGVRTKGWDIKTGIDVAPLPLLLQLMPLCRWGREGLGQEVLVTRTELLWWSLWAGGTFLLPIWSHPPTSSSWCLQRFCAAPRVGRSDVPEGWEGAQQHFCHAVVCRKAPSWGSGVSVGVC